MQFLPRLKKLDLVGCPKLRALPRQLGQEATSLEKLHIRDASCLEVVEDLPFLSEMLLIAGCDGLQRISNFPQLRELRVGDCPNVRRVEELGNLQQISLADDMREISSPWLHGLQLQCRQRHGEDLVVYPWT
jgi:Leucine-rich repeat (LRR) protein